MAPPSAFSSVRKRSLSKGQDNLEYILQTKIVGVAKRNVDFHNGILSDINQGIPGGPLTEVGALQRLEAARSRLRELQEECQGSGRQEFRCKSWRRSRMTCPGVMVHRCAISLSFSLLL